MNMAFFKYFDSYSEADTNSDTLNIIDAALTQRDHAWDNRWFYMITGTAAGDVRRVVNFIEASNKLILDRALSGTPAAGDDFQLFDIFSPLEIHDAINQAIEEAYPSFFGLTISDTELVLQEDTLEYSLASLTTVPWRIYGIWIERATNVIRGTATSATSTTILDSANPFGSVEVGWRVSIYAGTGAGQTRAVTVAAAGQLTVSTWTTTPDTTSKYAVWDPNDQKITWFQEPAAHFDQPEFPAKIYFTERHPSLYGMRIRLQYSYRPTALDDETDTSPVPQEYILPFVLSSLYQSRMDSNRADRSRYATLAERYRIQAEQYKEGRAFNEPSMTWWQQNDNRLIGNSVDNANPLGW